MITIVIRHYHNTNKINNYVVEDNEVDDQPESEEFKMYEDYGYDAYHQLD